MSTTEGGAAPGPYTTVDVGAGTGFHCYVVDKTGRKIAAIWGPTDEKVWTAALFAASHDMAEALELYDRTYAAAQTNPTPAQEAACIAAVRAALTKAGRKEKP